MELTALYKTGPRQRGPGAARLPLRFPQGETPCPASGGYPAPGRGWPQDPPGDPGEPRGPAARG